MKKGRTARMLRHAVELAESGKHVVLVAGGPEQATAFRRTPGISGNTMIQILQNRQGMIDYKDMCLALGPHVSTRSENSPLLIDHSVIEQEYGLLLREWQRCDQDAGDYDTRTKEASDKRHAGNPRQCALRCLDDVTEKMRKTADAIEHQRHEQEDARGWATELRYAARCVEGWIRDLADGDFVVPTVYSRTIDR